MILREGNYKTVFTYIDQKTKKKINDEKTLEWIHSLKIPPAYENVHISLHKNDKILAFGFDSKGRKQTIYNPIFIKQQSDKKFKKILENRQVIQQLKIDIEKLLKSKNAKEKEIAIILFLILHCGFRIGNKKYEEQNNSYGISTIKKKHIVLQKNTVKISFIGKKGMLNEAICNHPKIYKFFKEKRQEKDIESIFSVTSSDVNTFLKHYHVNLTAKDLRTWDANTLFIQEAYKLGNINKAIEIVSQKLHNTKTVCRKNYIDPNIIAFMEKEIKND